MKKKNLLSKAEMKNVLGGKLPPGDPGNPPCLGYHIICGNNDDVISYNDVCCSTIAEAQTFCRGYGYNGIYGCV